MLRLPDVRIPACAGHPSIHEVAVTKKPPHYPAVAAIDPGGTTGLAARLRDGNIVTWTERDKDELYSWMQSLAISVDHVVFETFASQIRTSTYGLHTIELVGGITALCIVLRIPYTRHAPNKRLPFLPRAHEHLRAKGERYVEHQADALAHLLAWEHQYVVDRAPA